jgi:hypothetical protein
MGPELERTGLVIFSENPAVLNINVLTYPHKMVAIAEAQVENRLECSFIVGY